MTSFSLVLCKEYFDCLRRDSHAVHSIYKRGGKGVGTLVLCSLATVTSRINVLVQIMTKFPKVGPLLVFSISLVWLYGVSTPDFADFPGVNPGKNKYNTTRNIEFSTLTEVTNLLNNRKMRHPEVYPRYTRGVLQVYPGYLGQHSSNNHCELLYFTSLIYFRISLWHIPLTFTYFIRFILTEKIWKHSRWSCFVGSIPSQLLLSGAPHMKNRTCYTN